MEQEKKITIKEIPLKIKNNNSSNEKTIKDYNNESVFLIILSVVLLFVTIFLIGTVLRSDSLKDEAIKITEQPTIDKSNTLFNKWRTQNDSLFIFGSDNKFSWYDNYQVLDNNFYQGTYTYKTSEEAVSEMGYTIDDFKKSFPNISNLENVYSLQLKPTYVYKSNLNVTKGHLKENETWWFIIIIDDDGNTSAYNKTLDARYNLKVES